MTARLRSAGPRAVSRAWRSSVEALLGAVQRAARHAERDRRAAAHVDVAVLAGELGRLGGELVRLLVAAAQHQAHRAALEQLGALLLRVGRQQRHRARVGGVGAGLVAGAAQQLAEVACSAAARSGLGAVVDLGHRAPGERDERARPRRRGWPRRRRGAGPRPRSSPARSAASGTRCQISIARSKWRSASR